MLNKFDSEAISREARRLSEVGEWTAAVSLLDSAVSTFKRDGSLLLLLAELMGKVGRSSDRLRFIQHACEVNHLTNVKWKHELPNELKIAAELHQRIQARIRNNSTSSIDNSGPAVFQYPDHNLALNISPEFASVCLAGNLGLFPSVRQDQVLTCAAADSTIHILGIRSIHHAMRWLDPTSTTKVHLFCTSNTEADWIRNAFNLNDLNWDAQLDVSYSLEIFSSGFHVRNNVITDADNIVLRSLLQSTQAKYAETQFLIHGLRNRVEDVARALLLQNISRSVTFEYSSALFEASVVSDNVMARDSAVDLLSIDDLVVHLTTTESLNK